MKKLFTLIVILFIAEFLSGQNVPRNMVVLEIATGTWCTYCPGAANAADQLVSEGKSVAVIEYHNGDAFVNTASTARNNYYNVPGFPTAHFDGLGVFEGGSGCPSGNVYSYYLPIYNTQIAAPSLLNLCMSGSSAGNNYTVNILVKKIGNVTSTNLRLHLVLTESNISTAPWPAAGCMTEVDFVERLMVPDHNGTAFSFSNGDIQTFTLSFTKDPTWVTSNCELVAFVQDQSTTEIFNGIKCALNSLPGTMMTLTDFSGNPTTGCAPVNVNFTSITAGVNTYSWAFPGGSPSSSTQANPSNISYTATGAYGAGLKVSNGVCKDSLGKSNYINVIAFPGVPGTPIGNTGMCVSPSPQLYSTSGAANATSYTWDLQPVAAGTLTPTGTMCTVNFNAGWTGIAQLKVQGNNSCGTGPWSSVLAISIDLPPAKPGTPSGPANVCQNDQNSEYSTSGSAGATSYVWNLTPSSAGTPNGNGTTCSVSWNATYTGSAQLKVLATTGGCQGPWSDPINIVVEPLPIIHNMNGGGAYCATGGGGVPVGLDGSQTGVNYTLYLDGAPTANVVPGNGGAISFGNQTQAGDYSALATSVPGNCNSDMNGTVSVSIDPEAPAVPETPTGPTEPNAGTSSDYITTGGAYATTYTWNVSPSNAGTPSGNTTTGTVSWNASYTGPASVAVQGVNSCGSSASSTSFEVTVLPPVGIIEPAKDQLVSIYPNPARGFVNLVPARNVKAEIKIINYLGSAVISLQGVNLNSVYKLDVSGLTPGVYFIIITENGIQQITKLIVE